MLDLDYEEMFKISIFALKINRAYPKIPKNKIWLLTMIPTYGLFCFGFCLILYSMLFHDLQNDNFTAACTNGVFSVLFIGVTFPYSIMVMKRQNFVKVIDKVKGDYAAANQLCTAEQDIVSEYANKASWVTKLWLFLAFLVFSVFPFQVVFLTIYYYSIGDFRFVYMYQETFPGDLETKKNEAYTYFFLIFVQIYYCVFTLLMFIGFPPLVSIFLLHGCGKIGIVEYRVSNLFNGENYDPKEIKQRLRNIVIPLQDVLEYVDILKDIFRSVYEVYMKGTTIVLPFASYAVLQAFREGRVNIECMAFVVAGTVLCLAPCYYSDLIMEKGLSLRMSVYTCGWESYPDTAMRRTLVIMLSRLERDVAIRMMFRTLNLDAFSELCHQSYALFNVLDAAWN